MVPALLRHGLALFLAAGLASQTLAAESSDRDSTLARRHSAFLEEVAFLLTDTEREAFLSLSQDHQRDRFVDRFWRARDPYPKTARNEWRDLWEANAEVARARFGSLADPRAQMILFFGEEGRSFRTSCATLLKPLEIWYFDAVPGLRPEFFLIFLRTGRDTVTLWNPRHGVHALQTSAGVTAMQDQFATRVSQECSRGDEILYALSMTADWEEVRDHLPIGPRMAEEWVESFLATSTDLPSGALPLPATVSTEFPGRRQSRTVVQMLLSVERRSAQMATTGRHISYNFLVDGEILRQGELFETFRYKFDLPGTASEDDGEDPGGDDPGGEDSGGDPKSSHLPLALERYLRPGTYTWIVKLQDLNSERFFRWRGSVEVPNLRLQEAAEEPPTIQAMESLQLFTEANATLADSPQGDHVVKLWAPSDRLLTGTIRVEAKTTGEGIARVAFGLDGRDVMAKSRPPYSVELNVGHAPRIHTLEARAMDAQGRVLARDEVRLNTGPHRFGVRLVEPQRGGRYKESVRAHAEVDLPEGESLDRLEFYLNETLVATLYQPPYIQPILIPEHQELGYVRAAAYLADGNSTEDLVFVNSPHPVDEVQVNFVELYTSVFDAKGRPAQGIAASDFVVKEDGILQEIRRFEPVTERPVHAGILLDNSTSMEKSLEEAEKAALKFFQSVLREKDRACLITFNDFPQLVVSFTNDPEILAGGLAGLVAEGETALHDSLIFALHYFSGLRGKRALILLSDGEDVRSRYRFEEVLEFARRTGVGIYSIGLGVSMRDLTSRGRLMRLATETGGRSFFIDDASHLTHVYQKIETELRSQYLIGYQSSQSGSDDSFREVELELLKEGLSAKTMRGYYP